jgi:hypothetical protein
MSGVRKINKISHILPRTIMKTFKQMLAEAKATRAETGSKQAIGGKGFESSVIDSFSRQGPHIDPEVNHTATTLSQAFPNDKPESEVVSQTSPYDYRHGDKNLVDIKRNSKNQEIRLNSRSLTTVAKFLDNTHNDTETSDFLKDLHDKREKARAEGTLTDEMHGGHIKDITQHIYDRFHHLRSHEDGNVRKKTREFMSSLSYVPEGKKAFIAVARKVKGKPTTTVINKDVFYNDEELTGKASGRGSKSDGHFRMSINMPISQPILGGSAVSNKDGNKKPRKAQAVFHARSKSFRGKPQTKVYT